MLSLLPLKKSGMNMVNPLSARQHDSLIPENGPVSASLGGWKLRRSAFRPSTHCLLLSRGFQWTPARLNPPICLTAAAAATAAQLKHGGWSRTAVTICGCFHARPASASVSPPFALGSEESLTAIVMFCSKHSLQPCRGQRTWSDGGSLRQSVSHPLPEETKRSV